MSTRRKGNYCILAGLLLFLLSSAACLSRLDAYQTESGNRYLRGEPTLPHAFAWSFWPDPCGIWFWLLVIGLGLRWAGRRPPAEGWPPISHEVALIYHLFPEETEFVRPQGGFLTEYTLELAEGLKPMPLPPVPAPGPLVYLKLRPSAAVQPKLAAAFFESLHRLVTDPLSFDLVSEQGAVYFQMTCAPADQAALEQQLALYFPGCEVEPHAPDFSALTTLTHLRYPRALGSKKTLGDFALDPYAALFAWLDNLPPATAWRLSVHCFPLPEATLLTALQYAERQAAGRQSAGQQLKQGMQDAVAGQVPLAGVVYRGYRQGMAERTRDIQRMLPEVIGELAAKLPAWGMLVQVAWAEEGDDPLNDEMERFFGQYETAEYKWLGTAGGAAWPLCLRFGHKYLDEALPYCVVACDELAALAHLPKAELPCERLERAGAASGLPPALYLE